MQKILFGMFSAALGVLVSFQSGKSLASEPLAYPVPAVAQALQKNSRAVVADVVPGTVWIDAEDFADYGGWYHDTQFVHLMGSGYLLAGGTGKPGVPVADAVTKVQINRTGNYTLWVRSRNWDREHSPGMFKISINGKKSSGVFGGGNSDAWEWQKGDLFALKEDEIELRLIDQTGYFGRCDALILTLDENFIPPEQDGMTAARAVYAGLDLKPAVHDGFDVIVVGGGPAGVSAAIAAARHGVKTALIQDRPMLGGNSGAEFSVGMNGAIQMHGHMRDGGIINEAILLQADSGAANYAGVYHELADAEPLLTVFVNMRVDGVVMESDSKIRGVKAVHSLDGTRAEFYGGTFIDCTGDGWLGYYAGATFRLGREAGDEFNEAPAPVESDDITMSGSLNAGSPFMVNTGVPVELKREPWAAVLPDGFARSISGPAARPWWLEYPGTVDDLWQGEYARDYLFRIAYGYADFLKNRWSKKDTAKNFDVNYVGPFLGRRESRRLEGDYILTLNDVMGAHWFEDSIAHYGWNLDVHHPLGIFSVNNPYECNYRVPMGGGIPFRCLYSKNISNLLMGGRCISVTHYALGTVRIMMTCASTGQAAGTAAAMCAARGITPRDVGRDHIRELQQRLLRDDQYIPALKNEDPADLARKAVCSASSVQDVWKVTEEYFYRPGTIQGSETVALNAGTVMCPVGRQQKIGSLNFWIRNTGGTDCEAYLNIDTTATFRDFDSRTNIAKIPVSIPAGFSGVLPVDVNLPVKGDFLMLSFLEKSGGISKVLWQRSISNPPRMCALHKYSDVWCVDDKFIPAFYAEPALEWEYDFGAANVINGITRCLNSGTVNMWSSDPAQPLPQWIELKWDEPQTIKEVQLIFDTNLDRYRYNGGEIPERVRSYDVQAEISGEWKTVVAMDDNIQRRRVHQFEPVSTQRLRVMVKETGGDRSARIFEIRAY
ncbi:MAG: FAD-dependent oxidoreductase [Kiritimatiellales bacterium]